MQIIDIEEPGSNKTEEELIVGIDFGTTNSLVAISENGRARTVNLYQNQDICPSIININGNQIEIGVKAPDTKMFKSIKRYLAKSSDKIKASANLMLQSEIINLEQDVPQLIVGDKKISFTDAAAEIFKHLIHQSEQTLGKKIKKSVISVPAHFDDSARGQVILAAKLAGLEVLRLISEPTAAAYAYGLDRQKEGVYLVYDLGGGTFDVSILSMTQGVLQVIATGGDNMLGGDDIDLCLAQHIAQESGMEVGSDLLSKAKLLKEALSTQESAEIEISGKKINITNVQFTQIIAPLIKRTINIAKNVIEDSSNIEIDGIILVGGATRTRSIKQQLSETFKVNIFDDLDPDKIVALGAAMQAENLTSKSNALLIDVVPLSIGLELYGSIVEKIILRNTPIPFSVTKQFTTHVDNQTGIKLHILQGERETTDQCLSLAHFELNEITPQKAGRANIEVTFAIDADGILAVTATDSQTGKTKDITIKPSYNVTEETVEQNLRSAYEHAREDHELKLLLETKLQAESMISGLEGALLESPDVIGVNEKQKICDVINELKALLQSADRDKIFAQMERLNNCANNFMQQHLDQGAFRHLTGKNIDKIKID